jgi:hypothetical protein
MGLTNENYIFASKEPCVELQESQMVRAIFGPTHRPLTVDAGISPLHTSDTAELHIKPEKIFSPLAYKVLTCNVAGAITSSVNMAVGYPSITAAD